MRAVLFSAFILAATGGAFAADMGPATTADTSIGKVLAGANGMTLYTFRNDKPGVSNCYDACASNWPPYLAEANDKPEGAYTLVERKDGTKQWALNGMPLYYWVKDTKAGDTTGNGVKGVWDAARP